MSDRNAELMKIGHDVAGGQQAGNAGFLLLVDEAIQALLAPLQCLRHRSLSLFGHRPIASELCLGYIRVTIFRSKHRPQWARSMSFRLGHNSGAICNHGLQCQNLIVEVVMSYDEAVEKIARELAAGGVEKFTGAGSFNIGRAQAETGQPPSEQQFWESDESYQNRLKGYSSVK